MKKAFLLLLIVSLLFVLPGYAETNIDYVLNQLFYATAPVDTDFFSLELDPDAVFIIQKEDDILYFSFYPFYGSGDRDTNFNIQYSGIPGSMMPDGKEALMETVKEQLTAGSDEYKISVSSYDLSDFVDDTFQGYPCVTFRLNVIGELRGQPLNACEHNIIIDSKGLSISIATRSEETVDQVLELLRQKLVIK